MRARRGSKEKGKKNLTKEYGNRIKRAKQSRQSAFPMCSPISRQQMHTHQHRWWPWSKIDIAHLPGHSVLFHSMRQGGPRKFQEQGYQKFNLGLFAMVACLQKKKVTIISFHVATNLCKVILQLLPPRHDSISLYLNVSLFYDLFQPTECRRNCIVPIPYGGLKSPVHTLIFLLIYYGVKWKVLEDVLPNGFPCLHPLLPCHTMF